jgi:hypothetical protein
MLLPHLRLGSLFVGFYGSQGYDGSIVTCLHAGYSENVKLKQYMNI